VGVPQGSVLGPLFFVTLVNDLAWELGGLGFDVLLKFCAFADDANMGLRVPLRELGGAEAAAALEPTKTAVAVTVAWARRMRLVFNALKSEAMVCAPPGVPIPKYLSQGATALGAALMVGGVSVSVERQQMKVLGVVLDRELTMQPHIASVLKTGEGGLHLLRHLRRKPFGQSFELLRTVYCAMVRSRLEYAVQVWGGYLTQANINALERIQDKAMKIMTSALPDTSNVTMRAVCQLDSLHLRRVQLGANYCVKLDHIGAAPGARHMVAVQAKATSWVTVSQRLASVPLVRAIEEAAVGGMRRHGASWAPTPWMVAQLLGKPTPQGQGKVAGLGAATGPLGWMRILTTGLGLGQTCPSLAPLRHKVPSLVARAQLADKHLGKAGLRSQAQAAHCLLECEATRDALWGASKANLLFMVDGSVQRGPRIVVNDPKGAPGGRPVQPHAGVGLVVYRYSPTVPAGQELCRLSLPIGEGHSPHSAEEAAGLVGVWMARLLADPTNRDLELEATLRRHGCPSRALPSQRGQRGQEDSFVNRLQGRVPGSQLQALVRAAPTIMVGVDSKGAADALFDVATGGHTRAGKWVLEQFWRHVATLRRRGCEVVVTHFHGHCGFLNGEAADEAAKAGAGQPAERWSPYVLRSSYQDTKGLLDRRIVVLSTMDQQAKRVEKEGAFTRACLKARATGDPVGVPESTLAFLELPEWGHRVRVPPAFLQYGPSRASEVVGLRLLLGSTSTYNHLSRLRKRHLPETCPNCRHAALDGAHHRLLHCKGADYVFARTFLVDTVNELWRRDAGTAPTLRDLLAPPLSWGRDGRALQLLAALVSFVIRSGWFRYFFQGGPFHDAVYSASVLGKEVMDDHWGMAALIGCPPTTLVRPHHLHR
jgi:hypothetical protein